MSVQAFSITEQRQEVSKGAIAAQQVRALRVKRGWSMRDLAHRLGLSAATVSAMENAQTGITVERLEQLAEVFGVTIATLLAADRSAVSTTKRSEDWRTFDSLPLDPAIRAAIAAFVQTGYHGAGMRVIAEHAAMSQAGVYHYYPSKHSMLAKIFDIAMGDLEWRVGAAADGVTGPCARLSLMVEALALFHIMRRDIAFIGASEMRGLEAYDRERIVRRRNVIQHRIEHEIVEANDSGLADCVHPGETGRAITTMCTALAQWYDAAGATPPQEVATRYGALALRMVGAVADGP